MSKKLDKGLGVISKNGYDIRICWLCKRHAPAGKPDPCLGELPGVINACCGHGKTRGYIIFSNMIGVNFRTFDLVKLLPTLQQRASPTAIDEIASEPLCYPSQEWLDTGGISYIPPSTKS